MTLTVYNKLVRDKIPSIIESKGSIPHYRVLDNDEFAKTLKDKLVEEAHEFFQSDEMEELADVLEVILALLETKHLTLNKLIDVCRQKERERGAFKLHLYLESVEEG